MSPRPTPTKKAAAKKASIKKKTTSTKKVTSNKEVSSKKRTTSGAFSRPMKPTWILAEIVGDTPLPRTEMVKRIWDYIKENDLQDKTDKKMINPDLKLRVICEGKTQVSMFDLAKYISRNVK